MPTQRHFKDRLLHLAGFLDELPPQRFDFTLIVDTNVWEGKQDLSCGATACALGWCGAIPRFRKAGLYLSRGGSLQNRNAKAKDGYYDSFVTGQEFFGLTTGEVNWLFSPGWEHPEDYSRKGPPGNASAKDVAEHIRQFVKEKWP